MIRLKLFRLLSAFPQLQRRVAMWAQQLNGWLRYGDRHMFRAISLEISTFCNRKCRYCPNVSHQTPREFMTLETYDAIVERLRDVRWNGQVSFIFYNEPLLDKRLPDLVARLKRRVPNCLPVIQSNGDTLTEELAQTLLDAGAAYFWISRHEPTSQQWLDRMATLKKRFPNTIRVVDMEETEKTVGLTNRGGLVQVANLYAPNTCEAPENCMHVDRFGNAVFCCNDYLRRHQMGNLVEKAIMEVWNNQEFKRLRQDLRAGIARLEMCRICLARQ